jgi:hypothetical protein
VFWDATPCNWAGISRRVKGFLNSILRLKQSKKNVLIDRSKRLEPLAQRRKTRFAEGLRLQPATPLR